MDYDKQILKSTDGVEQIYIVDFSFKKEDLDFFINAIGKDNVIWIDHHESAMKKLAGYEYLPGIRTDEWSGCRLSWIYFHRDEPVPFAVVLIDDMDRWEMHYEEQSKNFYEYTLSIDLDDPTCKEWTRLLHTEDLTDCLKIGALYRESKIRRLKKKIRDVSFESILQWQGKEYTMLQMNLSEYDEASEVGEIIWKEMGYDVAWCWHYRILDNGKYAKVNSLRSKPGGVDVSEIATSQGGGGHVAAAGWTEVFEDYNYSVVKLG
jgi:oligoribonuclease NrnB/cAMP/cGMP phosphodiesterase (DHH superfamily)